jgi:hypothetical protein
LYPGGDLAVAFVGAEGTAAASWDVTGVPEQKVMGAYHKALRLAGFRTTDGFSDLAETGYVHRGHGSWSARGRRFAVRGCRVCEGLRGSG